MTERPKVFVRDATGLVREFSVLDGLIWSLSASGPVGYALAYVVFFIFTSVSGMDMVGAVLLAVPPTLFMMLSYGMLTSAMPRSGGDYVFLTRIVHPAIGFAANFTVAFWQIIAIAIYTPFLFAYGVSPALGVLSLTTGDPTYSQLSAIVATPSLQFGAGVIVVLLIGLVMISGTRKMIYLMNATYIIALIGMLVGMGVLAGSSYDAFVNSFNSLLTSTTGSPNSFAFIIDTAKQAGFSIQPTTFGSTFEAAGLVGGYWLIWSYWSTYVSGELKNAAKPRTTFLTMFIPVLVNAGLVVVELWLILRITGMEFLGSATWLFFSGNWPISAPPVPSFFMSVVAGNSVLAALISFSFVLWLIPFLIILIGMCTRCMFSWAFDRLVPEKLAEISDRFHTPILATAIVIVVGLVALVFTTYFPFLYVLYTMSVIAILLFTFIPVALAAIMLPYRKPQIYGASQIARYKVAGVPLISVSGAIMLAWVLWMLAVLFKYPSLGGTSVPATSAIVAVWAIALVIFYVARGYRARQGIMLDQVYAELPPE